MRKCYMVFEVQNMDKEEATISPYNSQLLGRA